MIMLLNKNMQAAINIIVVGMVIGALTLGALVMLPAKSPLGTILGKVASDPSFLGAILANTDPKAVAEALNENPNFLKNSSGQWWKRERYK